MELLLKKVESLTVESMLYCQASREKNIFHNTFYGESALSLELCENILDQWDERIIFTDELESFKLNGLEDKTSR